MAYNAIVTLTKLDEKSFVITIVETDVQVASETLIGALPSYGRIIRQKTVLTAGTAATIDPIIGTATNPSGVNVVLENDTPGAITDNQPVGGACYQANPGNLFWRSRPNAVGGVENDVTTELLFRTGWVG
jgi:hypothetical protein